MGYGLTVCLQSLISPIQIHYISFFFSTLNPERSVLLYLSSEFVCFSQKANAQYNILSAYQSCSEFLQSSKQKCILGGEAPSQTSYVCQSCPSRKRSLTLEGARYTVYLKRIQSCIHIWIIMPDSLAAQEYIECLTLCIFRDIFTLQVHKITHLLPALSDNELLCIYLLLLCKCNNTETASSNVKRK